MRSKNKIYLKYRFELSILILLLFNFNLLAQFNNIIFQKNFHLGDEFYNKTSIQSLGDQNGDGYDDFLIFDCFEQKSYVFYGGNPVDTVPKFVIQSRYAPVAIVDLNNDGYKDIVFITDHFIPPVKVQVYFGGPKLNSIPDLEFSPPEGASDLFGSAKVLKDFNGDGRSELVFSDPFLRYSKKQFGTIYFYNTESEFDTIPHYIMYGDSADSISYNWGIDSQGDINGDGKTDFTILCLKNQGESYNYSMRFYLGNSNWDFTPAVTYYQEEHKFNVQYMHIIPDLNKDGKDDIVIKDYGLYPYWYYDAILKGSFPIDTIPSWGLNTQNEGIDVNQVLSLGDVNGDGYKDFISQTFAFPANFKLWLGGRKIHEVADKTWFGIDCGFGSTPTPLILQL